MAQFDKAIATAKRLIAKNGEAVIWRQIADAEPEDSSKPWIPGEVESVDYVVELCFLPLSRVNLETFTLIQGSEVPKGSVMGLMGEVPFEPNLRDVVVRSGVELRIESIDLLSPNGQKVLYTLVLKQ
jgi:hypothetical protein